MRKTLAFLLVAAAGCGTVLSSQTTQKLVNEERLAAAAIQDAQGTTCDPAKQRALNTLLLCNAASVLADGNKSGIDAGSACPLPVQP